MSALNARDRIKQVWSGTGNGASISLEGAVSPRFNALGVNDDGLEFDYLIENQAAGVNEVEVGHGIYTHSGTSLTRVRDDGQPLVNFTAGDKHVSVTLTARELIRLTQSLPVAKNALGTSGTLAVDLTKTGTQLYPAIVATGAIQFDIAANPVEGAQAIIPVRPTSNNITFGSDIFLKSSRSQTPGSVGEVFGAAFYHLFFEFIGGVRVVSRWPGFIADIAGLSIPASKIAADAVTTSKILDANVTEGKLEGGLLSLAGGHTKGLSTAEGFTLVTDITPPYRVLPQIVDGNITSLGTGGSTVLSLTPAAGVTFGEITLHSSGGIRFNTAASQAWLASGNTSISGNIVTVSAAFLINSISPTGVALFGKFAHSAGFGFVLRFNETNMYVEAYTAGSTTNTLFSTPYATGITNVIAFSYNRSTNTVRWVKNSGSSRYAEVTGLTASANWSGQTVTVQIGQTGTTPSADWIFYGAQDYSSSVIATRQQLEQLVRQVEGRYLPGGKVRSSDVQAGAVTTSHIASGAMGNVPSAGGFNPAAISLQANSASSYAQTTPVTLALAAGVQTGGAAAWITWTGNGDDVDCDGSSVKWWDGTSAAKSWSDLQQVIIVYQPALGHAVALVSGDAAGGGSFASLTGNPSDNSSLDAALNAKQDTVDVIPQGTVESGAGTTPYLMTGERFGQGVVALAGANSFGSASPFGAGRTGEVTRSLVDRLNALRVVNVRDFGAVGNGSTDDTAAITAAINYVNSLTNVVGLDNLSTGTKRVLWFPTASTYRCNSLPPLNAGISVWMDSGIQKLSQVYNATFWQIGNPSANNRDGIFRLKAYGYAGGPGLTYSDATLGYIGFKLYNMVACWVEVTANIFPIGVQIISDSITTTELYSNRNKYFLGRLGGRYPVQIINYGETRDEFNQLVAAGGWHTSSQFFGGTLMNNDVGSDTDQAGVTFIQMNGGNTMHDFQFIGQQFDCGTSGTNLRTAFYFPGSSPGGVLSTGLYCEHLNSVAHYDGVSNGGQMNFGVLRHGNYFSGSESTNHLISEPNAALTTRSKATVIHEGASSDESFSTSIQILHHILGTPKAIIYTGTGGHTVSVGGKGDGRVTIVNNSSNGSLLSFAAVNSATHPNGAIPTLPAGGTALVICYDRGQKFRIEILERSVFGAGRTGEVSRSLTSRIQDVINVKDWGIIGDDSVTDNTANLNALIAYVNSTTGYATLWFPSAPGHYGFTGASLTTLRTGVDVLMDTPLRFSGTQAAGVIWQIGSTTTNNDFRRMRLRLYNGGVGWNTVGQVGILLPNLRWSNVDLAHGQRFYTPFAIHALGGQPCWGNKFRIGYIVHNTVCLDCGARASNSWFNSNEFSGGGVLEENGGSTDTTIGIKFENTSGGISGNDNVITGDIVFQSLDYGIWTNQPHYAVVRGGRFESVGVGLSFAGSGDGTDGIAEFCPTHTRSLSVAVERRSGSNSWMDLRFDRRGAPLMWGGHEFLGYRARLLTRGSGSTQPDDYMESGAYFTTDGQFVIPNLAGWKCTVEPADLTHDIFFGARGIDISAEGFAVDEQYQVIVKANDQVRVTGPAGNFTEVTGFGHISVPINFDGTGANYLSRVGFSGAADSSLYSGSLWFRRTGLLNTLQRIFVSANDILVELNTDNRIFIKGENSGGSTILSAQTNTAITDSNWHHVAWSVDQDVGIEIRLDGVSDLLATPTVTSGEVIDFTKTTWRVGINGSGAEPFQGDLADIMIWHGVDIGLATGGNLAKLISGGAPVDPMAAGGAIATWGAPICDLRGSIDTWHINNGTGGDFTKNGAYTLGTGPVQL